MLVFVENENNVLFKVGLLKQSSLITWCLQQETCKYICPHTASIYNLKDLSEMQRGKVCVQYSGWERLFLKEELFLFLFYWYQITILRILQGFFLLRNHAG